MKDINDYIGVPYVLNGRKPDGFDCYGLVLLYFRDVHGIDLPDWTSNDGSLIAAVRVLTETVGREAAEGNGHEVDTWEKANIVTVGKGHLLSHIGVVVQGGVLHCHREMGTVYQPVSDFLRTNPGKVRWWLWQR